MNNNLDTVSFQTNVAGAGTSVRSGAVHAGGWLLELERAFLAESSTQPAPGLNQPDTAKARQQTPFEQRPRDADVLALLLPNEGAEHDQTDLPKQASLPIFGQVGSSVLPGDDVSRVLHGAGDSLRASKLAAHPSTAPLLANGPSAVRHGGWQTAVVPAQRTDEPPLVDESSAPDGLRVPDPSWAGNVSTPDNMSMRPQSQGADENGRWSDLAGPTAHGHVAAPQLGPAANLKSTDATREKQAAQQISTATVQQSVQQPVQQLCQAAGQPEPRPSQSTELVVHSTLPSMATQISSRQTLPVPAVSLSIQSPEVMTVAPDSLPETEAELPETTPGRSARKTGAMVESEPYALRQMHLFHGDEGVQAWIRDAGLSQLEVHAVAEALSNQLSGSGLRMSALMINGRRVSGLFPGNQYQSDEAVTIDAREPSANPSRGRSLAVQQLTQSGK